MNLRRFTTFVPSPVRELLSFAAPIGIVTYLFMIIIERTAPGMITLFASPDDFLPWAIAVAGASYLLPPDVRITRPARSFTVYSIVVILSLALSVLGLYALLPHGLLQLVPKPMQMLFGLLLMTALFWLIFLWSGTESSSEKK